jgi:hypothetical protein
METRTEVRDGKTVEVAIVNETGGAVEVAVDRGEGISDAGIRTIAEGVVDRGEDHEDVDGADAQGAPAAAADPRAHELEREVPDGDPVGADLDVALAENLERLGEVARDLRDDDPVPASECRECSVCEGRAPGDHHWLDDVDDETGDPIQICKHCEATRPLPDDDEDDDLEDEDENPATSSATTSTSTAAKPGPVQPALVPMTQEELGKAAHLLANLVGEKKAMVTRHQGVRVDMKKERTDLDERIANVARQIKEQGR